MRPTFEAMLAYRARGWVPILLHAAPDGVCTCRLGSRCPKPGKHSRGEWGDGAMPDELQIRAMAQRFPLSGVGVNCGASEPSLFVVDLDGPDGVASWQGWLDEHGRAPTLTSRTRRGYHLWFQQPAGEPLGNTAGTLAPGVDTRGAGGLVVAPPSVHASGHVYTWCQGPTEPAPCPSWLEDVARSTGRRPMPSGHPRAIPPPQGSPRTVAYATRAWDGELQRVLDAIPGGKGGTGRNDTLNRAAFALGQLVGAGLLEEEAVTDSLLAAAGAVGLDQVEALATIESGLGAGRKSPRRTAS